MGNLFINATKNFGNKVEDAITNAKGRIDGIHYSIADIPVDKIIKLDIDKTASFPEFPLYYLTKNNEYIYHYFNRQPVDLENGKKFVPSERNNKLICMNEHIDFSFLDKLPLSTREYSTKREIILKMVNLFYDKYYTDDYVMTPTFMINKVGSWEEILLLDVLRSTSEYLKVNSKEDVFLSLLLDPVLLDTSDIVSSIRGYVEMYPFVNAFNLTVINDNSMYHYSKDEYKNILIFIKELKSRNIKVYLQYCGIKDVIFSVLDVERYSVGWFGSYRNFDTIAKKISDVETSSFGRKVKKILTENFMSEIPLDYLEVLTVKECDEYFGMNKDLLDSVDYKELEQRYWTEMLKIIEKDDGVETQYDNDELINMRCEKLNKKINKAEINLNFMIGKLESKGRISDASKLEKNNLKHVKLYKEVINEFQERLFF